VFANGPIYPECHPFKPPETKDDGACAYPKCDAFCSECKAARRKDKMVQQVRKHEHSKVQRGKIEVNVRDTTHDEERNVMKRPSKKRDLSNVQKVFPFICIHISIFTLLPEQIHP